MNTLNSTQHQSLADVLGLSFTDRTAKELTKGCFPLTINSLVTISCREEPEPQVKEEVGGEQTLLAIPGTTVITAGNPGTSGIGHDNVLRRKRKSQSDSNLPNLGAQPRPSTSEGDGGKKSKTF